MYRKILVPLDGSKHAECVLPYVKSLASDLKDPEIILLRVCEPPVILADYPPDLHTEWDDHVRQETAHIQQQCRLYLDGTEQNLIQAGLKVRTDSRLGKAPEEIIDYAIQNQVDLIIIASHGSSGITRWAYGNTANRVLQASTIPVMIIRPEECKASK
jgi:nucleotide-binding universal stress UspA family protein